MQFYRKLAELRKQAGWSQEILAKKAGVSRQTVFKWEAGLASPSLDNLLVLCRLFDVSADELTGNAEEEEKSVPASADEEPTKAETTERAEEKSGNLNPVPSFFRWHYEFKSKKRLFGVPLVHINLGTGFYKAKGIVAIGNLACGGIALGVLSLGVLSFGALAFGLLAFAALAAGGIAFGGAAVGVLAFGGAAVGVIAVGGAAVGTVAAGGAAVASRIAVTSADGYARATLVLSDGIPRGVYSFLESTADGFIAKATELFPSFPRFILRFLSGFAP